MLPPVAVNDLFHASNRDSKFFGYGAERNEREPALNNLNYLIFGKFAGANATPTYPPFGGYCGPMIDAGWLRPDAMTSLAHHISGVVGGRPDEKMIGADAAPNIAMMANKQAIGNFMKVVLE